MIEFPLLLLYFFVFSDVCALELTFPFPPRLPSPSRESLVASALPPLLFPQYLFIDVYGGCVCFVTSCRRVVCLRAHHSVLCSGCLGLFFASALF